VDRQTRPVCPACGNSDVLFEREALIAPWLKDLAQISATSCVYKVCQGCRSGWVDLLFSSEELDGIYREYRGDRYLRTRRRWEQSYSPNLNESLDNGAGIFKKRKSELERVIHKIDPSFRETVRFVLDVGGGHGSLIPDWPSIQRRVVIDVSGSTTEPGVESIREWSQLLQPHEIQLVLNCMVLEHLNNPREFLAKLREDFLTYSIFPESALFYFEVPQGVPDRDLMPIKTHFMRLVSRSHYTWSLLDRLVVQNPRNWPLRIAEHIQFFTGEGLRCLLQDSGFEPLLVTDFEVNQALDDPTGIRFSGTHAAVARLK